MAGVSFAQMDVPPKVAQVGTIDGRPKMGLGPVSLTGTVQTASVASRRAVGVPRLLSTYTTRPASVAGRAAVGRPSVSSGTPIVVVAVLARGVASRAAVGRPGVASVTPPLASVPWWVRLIEWLRGRR